MNAEAKLISTFNKETKKYLDAIEDENIIHLVDKICEISHYDKTIFTVGNGGSAATASHLANDLQKTVFNGNISIDRKRIKANCLSDNIPVLTAWANDVSYDDIFSQQLVSVGSKGDMLIAFSVSGDSKNIMNAITMAKQKGIYTFGLFGKDGGKGLAKVDSYILVNTQSYGVVESVFAYINHLITDILKIRMS